VVLRRVSKPRPQDVVELQKHETLEEMLHQAMNAERQIRMCHMYQKYASCNSSKEKKEEDKSLQGKSSKPSSFSSSLEYHRYYSSYSKDYKYSSSLKDHISYSSSPKCKFKKKQAPLNVLNFLNMDTKIQIV